jgi:hypothetical protein
MLRPDALQSYCHAQPFRPFRVTMNSGKTYDIRHPDFIHVARDFFLWFYPPVHQDDFPSRWESVSLLPVQNVEHIDQPAMAATQGN